MSSHEVCPHLLANGHEVRRHAPEHPFRDDDHPGHGRREVPPQKMTMKGVHTDRDSSQDRGNPAEHAGFGCVGVDDDRAVPAEEPDKEPQSPHIVERPHAPTQPRHDDRFDVRCPQLQVVRLVDAHGSAQQHLLESCAIEPAHECCDLEGGPSHVRSGNDSDHRRRPDGRGRHVAIAERIHSRVDIMPSRSDTGEQPGNSSRRRSFAACESRTSPARGGWKVRATSWPSRLSMRAITSSRDDRVPNARFTGAGQVEDSNTARVSTSTTVPTYVKSRVWRPSP